jgi:hypothetical protein
MTGNVDGQLTSKSGIRGDNIVAHSTVVGSQIGSSIVGDVTAAGVADWNTHATSELGGRSEPTSLLRRIWNTIPGFNGIVQICDKIIHLFSH